MRTLLPTSPIRSRVKLSRSENYFASARSQSSKSAALCLLTPTSLTSSPVARARPSPDSQIIHTMPRDVTGPFHASTSTPLQERIVKASSQYCSTSSLRANTSNSMNNLKVLKQQPQLQPSCAASVIVAETAAVGPVYTAPALSAPDTDDGGVIEPSTPTEIETRPAKKARPSKPRTCQHLDADGNPCSKLAQGRTNLCASHGGGRRCQTPGCTKLAQGSTDLCAAHGGGRRCQYLEGCDKSAAGATQFCKAHGGGKRCMHPEGCTKSAQGSASLCMAHGGGRRCQHVNCTRIAISTTNFCREHGGVRLCRKEGCKQSSYNNAPFCAKHRPEKSVQPKDTPKATGSKRPRREQSLNAQRAKDHPTEVLLISKENVMKADQTLPTACQVRSADGDGDPLRSVTNSNGVDCSAVCNAYIFQDMASVEEVITGDTMFANLADEQQYPTPKHFHMDEPITTWCETPGEQTCLTVCRQSYVVQFCIQNCATDAFANPRTSDQGPSSVRLEYRTDWAKQSPPTGHVLVPPNCDDISASQESETRISCSELSSRNLAVSTRRIHAPQGASE